MSAANENETTGLEDVTWVKCLKSLGTLPNLPLFQILHDYDLSEEGDTVSTCVLFCSVGGHISVVLVLHWTLSPAPHRNNF